MIPEEIKKARFDLYLVFHDGSFGVHNYPYDIQLLGAAQTWVIGQMPQSQRASLLNLAAAAKWVKEQPSP